MSAPQTPLHPIQHTLRHQADTEQSKNLSRFFKTGPGQYGHGDHFLGIKVPQQRMIARQFQQTPLPELPLLLHSPWHEERMTGFLIVLRQYQQARVDNVRKQIFEFILAHQGGLNNWDLVDVIVPGTIGDWLWRNPDARQQLQTWIQSDNLWQRRIAVLATFALIKYGEYSESLILCETQMRNAQPMHDLMQKASGWMLREIGKRDVSVLIAFLEKHAHHMPRTMLRYAIEKLPKDQRLAFMNYK